MRDKIDSAVFIITLVIVIVCIVLGLLFTKMIVESDLPTWLKFFLLR